MFKWKKKFSTLEGHKSLLLSDHLEMNFYVGLLLSTVLLISVNDDVMNYLNYFTIITYLLNS